jgi:polyisoprenyl-phosphate glycosyltransferase
MPRDRTMPPDFAFSEAEPLLLSLVIPVLNESETIGLFMARIEHVFGARKDLQIECVFVNDGSTDDTLGQLIELRHRHPSLLIVDLSRNFGKEAALTAGLMAARGRVVVPIDVDLQDPPELILDMLEHWRTGHEVVLAQRVSRDSDTWPKRRSAELFYAIHNKIASPRLPPNVGDFRLLDRSVIEALKQLPESNRFMKGLFAWVGFRTACISYVRPPRSGGSTKFSGWRLWNFAMEGFTSFSTTPLRIWTYLGAIVASLSICYAIFIALRVLLVGVDLPGYASLMVAISFFAGVQLIGIGVLGEYVGRTYIESKRRPIYIVKHYYGPKP